METIYRVGRATEPLAWPPASITGRYSDPEGQFGVLYGATEREAAFLETIQTYRPALLELALLKNATMPADSELPRVALGLIPAAYFERKRIAAFRVTSGYPCLDLRSVETHAALRTILAAELLAAGYKGSFNFGEIIGSDYVVTQRIAGWAFDQGYGGIVYPSAHDHASSCWALFDRVEIVPLGAPEIIQRDDPDLVAAAALFGLIVPE